MRWALLVIGGILVLVGAVWALQGLNILLGSPMTGQPFWAVAGSITLLLGVVLCFAGWRRSAG